MHISGSRIFYGVALGLATLLGAGSAVAAAPLGNLAPRDALKAFETEPGFTVELVAAEPLTIEIGRAHV